MSLKEKVEEIVEKEIRPALMADGGGIAVMDVDEKNGIVKVQLLGACGGCPMSTITLTMFVERHLRNKIPEIKKVIPV
ncbi:NifU family protein [Archaeoglobales archaeon]|nr:MAG: NifU family protein [Archaeoglobales archaeon]